MPPRKAKHVPPYLSPCRTPLIVCLAGTLRLQSTPERERLSLGRIKSLIPKCCLLVVCAEIVIRKFLYPEPQPGQGASVYGIRLYLSWVMLPVLSGIRTFGQRPFGQRTFGQQVHGGTFGQRVHGGTFGQQTILVWTSGLISTHVFVNHTLNNNNLLSVDWLWSPNGRWPSVPDSSWVMFYLSYVMLYLP